MAIQKLWQKEGFVVAARSLAIYVLCQGTFYFYDRSVAFRETREMGVIPYVVITLWWAWILFHNRVLVLSLLLKRKWIYYILALLAGLLAASFLQIKLVQTTGRNPPLYDALGSISYYTLIGALLFIAFLYMKERKDFFQVATLKKEVELQQLKNQLNPHFLFNSLNNIYSYNLENNTYGNDLILKLSQLMRFMVESGREEVIAVGEEVDFISNYIAFEKERLGQRCNIAYEEKLQFPKKTIPPLLLFPFVENAFKHGANSIGQGNIDISIENSERSLVLKVRNGILHENNPTTKTGLPNVGRRLDLLFPGKYRLDIQHNEREYFVNLTLDLS